MTIQVQELLREIAWVPRRVVGRQMERRGPCARRLAGTENRRVLGAVVRDGVEYSWHATKGLRAKRVAR